MQNPSFGGVMNSYEESYVHRGSIPLVRDFDCDYVGKMSELQES